MPHVGIHMPDGRIHLIFLADGERSASVHLDDRGTVTRVGRDPDGPHPVLENRHAVNLPAPRRA